MAFPSHPSRIRAAVFLYGSEQHSTQLAGKAKKRKDGGRVSLGRAVGRWYTRWWHSPSLARPTNQVLVFPLPSSPLVLLMSPFLPPLTSAGQKLSQFVFMVHYFHFWRFLASPS